MSISLVIPAFNEQDVIARCLDHALAQEVPFDEIIVVDNNSTDDTAAIVEAYAAKHPTIRLITETTPGVAAARRAGFNSVTSELIGRIDAEVLISPRWSASVTAALGDGEYAAVTGVLMFYDAPFQRQMRSAYMWTMKIQGKGDGGRIPALIGGNMGMTRSAWADIRDELVDRSGVHEDGQISGALSAHDLAIYFAPDMYAEQSPRRVLVSPVSNARYIWSGVRTSFASGQRMDGILRIIAFPFNFGFMTLLWMMFRPWDPDRQRWDIRRLFRPDAQRISPVT